MNLLESLINKDYKPSVLLMTHAVLGYPDISKSRQLIQMLDASGSDIIELQIPFSDPIADGPTIMKASDIAIQNGMTVIKALTEVAELSKKLTSPIVLMAYYNSVFVHGVELFCKKAAAAGVSGLIIPDVPPEEDVHEKLSKTAEANGLYLIRVVSPASSDHRLSANAKLARGFIYCISKFGVTGASSKLEPELEAYLKRVRTFTNLPIAVGFGISKPEQITALIGKVEIVIVGSAIINKYDGEGLDGVATFIKSLKAT